MGYRAFVLTNLCVDSGQCSATNGIPRMETRFQVQESKWCEAPSSARKTSARRMKQCKPELQLRPDGYAINPKEKQIVLLEFTRAMDTDVHWEEYKDAEKTRHRSGEDEEEEKAMRTPSATTRIPERRTLSATAIPRRRECVREKALFWEPFP